MLGDLDLKRLRDGLKDVDVPLTLVFHRAEEETPFSGQLSEAIQEIVDATGGTVHTQEGDGAGLPARPGMSLHYRGHANIHYLAVPEGPELPPFLDALLGLPRGAAGINEDWVRRLGRLQQRPTRLYVFMATPCPHCAQVVRNATRLSLANPQVSTFVINAQHFPALAERFSVKSVPMVLLDEGLATIGAVSADELVDQILARDDEGFEERVFRSLVETGRFAAAAERMTAGLGAVSFLALWKKSTTSDRIGLMLASEQALEADPACLRSVVEDLMGILTANDAALRGDTADLLGQVGDRRAAGALKKLLDDPNADVAEIAGEALDALAEDVSDPTPS